MLTLRRYNPNTFGTKRASVKAIINTTPSNRAEDMKRNRPEVEELMNIV